MLIHLVDKIILAISGNDRHKFLQGIITNDINLLEQHKIIYSLFLTAQGKYFCDMFIYHGNDSIYLEVNKARAEEILAKLLLYRLRSNVEISLTNYQVFWSNREFDANFLSDPRSNKMGFRAICFNKVYEETDSLLEYEKIRINAYLPEGDKDLIIGKSLPLEYGLDQYNGFSFKKGCYIGQEVTARIHYTGTIRKEIVQVYSQYNLPELGQEIICDNIKLGIFCSNIDNQGLALVKTEFLENINNFQDIKVNDIIISLKRRKSDV